MKSSSVQVVALVVFCSFVFAAAGRVVPPHLTWTEDPATTITVAWERNTAGRGTVQYGATTNYAFSVSDSGGYRRHAITLRNLSVGTLYHYKVSSTGLPNIWEHDNFGSAAGPAASDDNDGDGLDNWGEYVADTEPTNAASTFVGQAAEGSKSEIVLTWPGAANRKYHVYRTLDITNTFQPLAGDLSVNIYTDTVSAVERAFYKFGVELP